MCKKCTCLKLQALRQCSKVLSISEKNWHSARKRGLSHHHAMHNFLAIMSIILMFHESHPEKYANHTIRHHFHAITPIILLCYELFSAYKTSHTITPTNRGASVNKAVFPSVKWHKVGQMFDLKKVLIFCMFFSMKIFLI